MSAWTLAAPSVGVWLVWFVGTVFVFLLGLRYADALVRSAEAEGTARDDAPEQAFAAEGRQRTATAVRGGRVP